MAVYESVTPPALIDGVNYCLSKNLPAVEGDLGKPVGVIYAQAVVAIVQFSVSGNPVTNSSYVVLQTDLFGNNVWVDVAGAVFTALTGTGLFVLSSGVPGPLGVQVTRLAGIAPQTTGANGMTLGGRLRFIGKTTLSSGSSSSSSSGSVGFSCNVTINYKLLGLR
jgi:hypothetical protein